MEGGNSDAKPISSASSFGQVARGHGVGNARDKVRVAKLRFDWLLESANVLNHISRQTESTAQDKNGSAEHEGRRDVFVWQTLRRRR